MKIPPNGDNFRIQPGTPGDAGKIDANPKGAEFEKKIGETAPARNTQSTGAAEGPQSQALRTLLGNVDKNDPQAAELVADKLVEWTLTEKFGPGAASAKGMEDVRREVREQLLSDPAGEAKIRGILGKL